MQIITRTTRLDHNWNAAWDANLWSRFQIHISTCKMKMGHNWDAKWITHPYTWFQIQIIIVQVNWIIIGMPNELQTPNVSLRFNETVATPFWGKCEDETHTPKSGNLESFGIPKNSKLDSRGQNILHWGILYTIRNFLNCRCLNGLTWAIWTSSAHVISKRRAGSQTNSLTPDH